MTRVMALVDNLALSTIRIECVNTTRQVSVGTGFFYSFARSGNLSVPAIITNRHVVAGAIQGVFHLTRADGEGNPLIGQFDSFPVDNFEQQWIGHPDGCVDLCAMPIGRLLNMAQQRGTPLCFRAFDETVVAKSDTLAELGPAEEVLMIGYPVGIWDPTNNMPIFRRGITATDPSLDYQGKKEFLIDAACFPGSSGSPVLLYNVGSFMDKRGRTFVGASRLRLLGVMYAVPQYTVTGQIVVVPAPTHLQPVPQSRIPTNLGFVIKAERLLEFEPIFKAMVPTPAPTPMAEPGLLQTEQPAAQPPS